MDCSAKGDQGHGGSRGRRIARCRCHGEEESCEGDGIMACPGGGGQDVSLKEETGGT